MSPLVILPTYQEAENIADVLQQIRAAAPSADVLVVDDGSPDGTGDLAEEAASDVRPGVGAPPSGEGRTRPGLSRRLRMGPRA